MDSFLEYLMLKKPTGKEIGLKALIVFLAVLSALLAFSIFASVPVLRSFSFFAVLCIGYIAYIIISRMTIEYEYIFTNGDLDIDIIRGKRVRKRMVTVKCKDIKIMEQTEDIAQKTKTGEKSVIAVYNPDACEIYKIEAVNKSGRNVLIYFQPTEKLISEMKKYNPRNIIWE